LNVSGVGSSVDLAHGDAFLNAEVVTTGKLDLHYVHTPQEGDETCTKECDHEIVFRNP